MAEHYICTDKEFSDKICFSIEKEHIYHISYRPNVYWIYEKGVGKGYCNIDNSYSQKLGNIYGDIKKYMNKNIDFKYIYEVSEDDKEDCNFNILRKIDYDELSNVLKEEEEREEKLYNKYVEYEIKRQTK